MAQMKVSARPTGRQNINQATIRQVAGGAGVRRDLDRRATRVAAYMRISIPMRTGRLRSSVRAQSGTGSSGNARVEVLVGRGVPYAQAYLFGAKPHRILPRRKKMLRFTQGGQVVFSRGVNHPGNKPHDVLDRSTRFWKD